jgi:N-methylhydantoinase B
MSDPVHGGNGATHDGDGPTNQLIGNGDLPTNPAEVMETRHPVLIERVEFAADVRGSGKFFGGKGVRKDYRFLEDGCYVALVTENTADVTAKGINGGANGQPGYFIFNPGTPGEMVYRKRVGSVGPFPRGTVLRVTTGGGGGWGSARERDPAMILADLRNGFIDRATAESVCNVVIVEENGEWVIDQKQTHKRRAA